MDDVYSEILKQIQEAIKTGKIVFYPMALGLYPAAVERVMATEEDESKKVLDHINVAAGKRFDDLMSQGIEANYGDCVEWAWSQYQK